MTDERPEEKPRFIVNSQHNWVASYPKSGNTWVRFLLRSYYGGKLSEYSDSALLAFQTVSSIPAKALTIWQEMMLRPAALFYLSCSANNEQTLVKTHHTFGKFGVSNDDQTGLPLFSQMWVRKAIYVMRDPRDVACSLKNHMGTTYEEAVNFIANKGTLTDDYQMTHILTGWSEHVHTWTTQDAIPTCIVKYEDLREDPARELRDMVEFLEWGELDEDRIRQAVEQNTFEVWQEREKREGFKEAKKHGPFFRRGIVGAWRDELSPELVERVEKDHGEEMLAQGYQPELVEVAA